MQKKGFTLTELLAVIVIIAILSIAAISGFSTMTKNSKEKSLDSKIDNIETAAYKYAKENNINKKTTISVNKLVVLGYLQPDESSDEGLSVLSNPVTQENMICNTIDILMVNNDIKVKYNKNKKDCTLSNEEEDEGKIGVVGYCVDSPGTVIHPDGNTFRWTKCNRFYVRTNPQDLNENDIETIAFDYDGNSYINKNGALTKNNPLDIKNYKNIISIDGVENQVVIVDVGITYTMNTGRTYYRHVIVRIDQEKPTSSYVVRNDISKKENVLRKVDVFIDDGNGSGGKKIEVRGPSTNINKETPYKDTVELATGTYSITPIDEVGNRGDEVTVNIVNIPEGMSCNMAVLKTDGKQFSTNYSYSWYNKDIKVNLTSPKTYKNGIGYDISEGVAFSGNHQFTKYLEKNETLDYSKEYSAEMEVKKFYGGLRNQEKNQEYARCQIEAGIDKTKPVVTISPNGSTVYKQKHRVEITISDNKSTVNSGFDKNATYTLNYAWVKDGEPAPLTWKTANLSVSENKKILIVGIEDNTDYKDVKMTGTYRLYIKSSSGVDLAQNPNDLFISETFKLDNTPPTCVSSGGNNNWTNGSVTIKGTCTDDNGTTDQAGCIQKENSGKTTYDSLGNVYKLYDTEKESTNESPGYVYDEADNSTACPADQTVKIDQTPPNAPTLTMTHSYIDTNPNGSKATVYSNNTWSTKKPVYMTDARSKPFTGPQATDAGTIKSDVSYIEISSDNSTWTTYNYDYTNELYAIHNQGTSYRYFRAIDNAGNKSSTRKYTIKIDTVAPECGNISITPSGTLGDNGWYKSNISFTVSGNGKDSTSDIKSETYSVTDVTNDTSGVDRSVTIHDKAGNSAICGKITVKKDATAPGCGTISLTPSGTLGNNSWYRSNITFSVSGSGTDSTSGIKSETYSVTDVTTDTSGVDKSVTIHDKAGNTSTCGKKTVKKDATPPSLSIKLYVNGKEVNEGQVQSKDVTRKITVSDNFDAKPKVYASKIKKNKWALVTDYDVEFEDDHSRKYKACDEAGNCTDPITVRIVINEDSVCGKCYYPSNDDLINIRVAPHWGTTDGGKTWCCQGADGSCTRNGGRTCSSTVYYLPKGQNKHSDLPKYTKDKKWKVCIVCDVDSVIKQGPYNKEIQTQTNSDNTVTCYRSKDATGVTEGGDTALFLKVRIQVYDKSADTWNKNLLKLSNLKNVSGKKSFNHYSNIEWISDKPNSGDISGYFYMSDSFISVDCD